MPDYNRLFQPSRINKMKQDGFSVIDIARSIACRIAIGERKRVIEQAIRIDESGQST